MGYLTSTFPCFYWIWTFMEYSHCWASSGYLKLISIFTVIIKDKFLISITVNKFTMGRRIILCPNHLGNRVRMCFNVTTITLSTLISIVQFLCLFQLIAALVAKFIIKLVIKKFSSLWQTTIIRTPFMYYDVFLCYCMAGCDIKLQHFILIASQ